MSKPKTKEVGGEVVYIAADGTVHSTPQGAVAASLTFENTSNTGSGCSQSPENISPPPSPPKK